MPTQPDDDLGQADKERVRSSLGAIGSRAVPPRPFAAVRDASAEMVRPDAGRSRRPVAAGVAAALVALAVVGVALVRRDDDSGQMQSRGVADTVTDESALTTVVAIPTSTIAALPTVESSSSEVTSLGDDRQLRAALVGGPWIVVTINGAAPDAIGSRPYFELRTDGTVSGSDGCNLYGSSPTATSGWYLDDGTLNAPSAMGSAAVACDSESSVATPFGARLELTGTSTLNASAPSGLLFTATRLDATNRAATGDLYGSWTDGSNIFTFHDEGTITFTRVVSCDGTFTFSATAELDVSFDGCGADAVALSSPIFRNATVHLVDGALFIAGDAGVHELRSSNTNNPTVDQSGDPLRDILTANGADVAGAPVDAVTLGDATYCGSDNTGSDGMFSDQRNDTGRRCLLDAHPAGLPAVLVAISATDEGGPLVTVIRTNRDGHGVVYNDLSQDTYNSSERAWRTDLCPRLTT